MSTASLERARADALPEHLIYQDRGCSYSPTCLTCPLTVCKYDTNMNVRRSQARASAARRMWAAGRSVDQIAAESGYLASFRPALSVGECDMAYAVNLGGTPRPQTRPTPTKRKDTVYDPLKQTAKMVADMMYDSALQIATILAPDEPMDTDPLDPFDQWWILEDVAMELSPHVWEDPEAIADLMKLRRQFAPELAETSSYLDDVARLRRVQKRWLPNPDVTPTSAEWERKNRS